MMAFTRMGKKCCQGHIGSLKPGRMDGEGSSQKSENGFEKVLCSTLVC